jgi:hypothetical protein
MDDEKEKAIAALRRNFELSSKMNAVYAEMFSRLQEVTKSVLTDLEGSVKGGEPITEVDRARYEIAKEIFVVMSETMDTLAETINGHRK